MFSLSPLEGAAAAAGGAAAAAGGAAAAAGGAAAPSAELPDWAGNLARSGNPAQQHPHFQRPCFQVNLVGNLPMKAFPC